MKIGDQELANDNLLIVERDLGLSERHPAVSLRCPHCGNIGSFDCVGRTATYYKAFSSSNGKGLLPFALSIRICPNIECNGLVTTITQGDKIVLQTFPPELIDFKIENVPERILNSIREAIACHSIGAFRASAIMVRRVLEEICEEQNASGKNLHERLESLQKSVLIPKSLIKAMFELKLLGNDAAHVESKSFDQVGKEEIEVAIDLAKEIIKALYQLQDIVGRLKSLKSPHPK